MNHTTMTRLKRTSLFAVAATVLALTASLSISTQPARAAFGISVFDQQITSDAAGDPFTQAGGHPYSITTEINVNSHVIGLSELNGGEQPDAETKDIVTELPPGLVGNPAGIPQCTESELAGGLPGFIILPYPECPISSQVGVIQVRTDLYHVVSSISWVVPVYNMVSPANAPAEFGFSIGGEPILLSGNVRNGGDFGINVISADIPTTLPVDGITLTFWGVPADPSHDSQRCNWAGFGMPGPQNTLEAYCPPEREGTVYGPNHDPVAPKAFLTVPVSCESASVAMRTKLEVDSWDEPGVFAEDELVNHLSPGFPSPPDEWGAEQPMTGCDRVPFNPSVTVEPSNHEADTPTGLSVDFKLPQEGLLAPNGISTSDVRKTVVTLPEGVALSPSAAQGLGSCSPSQIGLNGGNPAQCPDSSELGSIEIDTPLLESPLRGSIYLAKQNDNPFGSLVAIYLVAEGSGVVLKLAGKIELDASTGRVKAIVENSPQLPFSDLKLDFNGGPRAPLVNPHVCGTYQTMAEMTPWSGTPPVTFSSGFQITSGPERKPCPTQAAQSFTPSFAAGTTNNQAGAFSPLTVTLTRADGEQQLGGVVVKTPPGLLGTLTGIPLCEDPQASAGTCSPASEIGAMTVGAGAGANPLYVYGGKVFLTKGYKGGEFGLSIVVPAVAGPFDLGTVVVRGSIKLDPVTTALTVTTDSLPTILDGIPLDLRTINVRIDRQAFIFNPTNCDPLSLSGILTGGLGAQSAFSDSFQVTNCGRLGFSPKFTVTTPSKTSRANGAGLKARIAYPHVAQTNIAKVKVNLPRQLPSRLTTLQKACPDTTFDQNPDACSAASKIGLAKAVTPVLPVPLEGPVYFVSHGGAAFPDLVIVLKGYGITFDLDGTTFISKAGITSTSFKQVPDVPIDSFELTLPRGPNSALAANGNLCTAKLKMPTAFIAQDGAEIHQTTPITPTGCLRHKGKRAKPSRSGERHKRQKG